MKRITKIQSKIANDHLQAAKSNTWSYSSGSFKGSTDCALAQIKAGSTFEDVHNQIEAMYCTTGSIVISGLMNHTSQNYLNNYRKGWKILLNRHNIS